MISPFPLVCRADLEGNEYHGFINLNDTDYRIRVYRVRSSHALELELEPDLKVLLRSEEERIRCRLARSTTVLGFLAEFKEILDHLSVTSETNNAPSAPPADAMQHIIEEIEEVGWDNVTSLHEGFRAVGIVVSDEVGSTHTYIAAC